jgi:stalled ribosome rescue protein Dom34
MTPTKKLGIWMDHSSAHLMTLSGNHIEHTTITSKFTHDEKEKSLANSENVMHNKEQHQQAEFYKELGDSIRNYDDVIIFGPTNAKSELANFLKADHRFAKIKIETKSASQMSDSDRHTFVKDYFSNQLHK